MVTNRLRAALAVILSFRLGSSMYFQQGTCMTKLMGAAVASLMLVSGAAQAQNGVTNGGFEDPVIGGSCCNTVTVPNTFPGWTVTTGDINVVNGTFGSANGNLAIEGSQYLDLIGESGSGGISQSIATIAGSAYQLSFAYSHNIFSVGAASASYAVGSALTGSFSHNTGTNTNLDWQFVTQRFVAGPGTSTLLSFTNVPNGTSGGIFLDAVSVTAVPEPAAWAMMIGGFGLIGGAMRRRRRTSVAFA